MKKFILSVLIILLALGAFVATLFYAESVPNGEVYEKCIIEAHSEQITILTNIDGGENIVTETRYYPKIYSVKIRILNRINNKYNYYVLYFKNVEDYSVIKIGDIIKFDKSKCYVSEPYDMN